MEAHPLHAQASYIQDVDDSRSRSAPPLGTSPPPLRDPVHCSAPRRPAPADSAQPPLSKRHASSPSRWHCPVPNCPDHCPISSRGGSSFSAMKVHLDRHLGSYLDGDLPVDWLQGAGYEVCEVCNRSLSSRFRGRCTNIHRGTAFATLRTSHA